MQTGKTLIRLGGYPGWSDSSLGAQVIYLVLSCCGPYTCEWTKTLLKRNIENVTRILFIKLKYDSLLHSYLINHFAGRQKTWVKRLLQGHGNTQTQVHEITVTVLGELDVVYVAFGGSFIVVCECPLACNILRFLSFIQRLNIIWATSWENLFLPYANNKGADQPAHPHSLISAFVVTAWIVQYLTFL